MGIFPGIEIFPGECPFRVYMKKRKGYIFTNKRHSERGIMSVLLAVISLVSLGIVVMKAYQTEGTAPAGSGATGLLALLYSVVGIVLGIVTTRDKGYYRFFPVLGTVLNGIVIGLVCLILHFGANY